MKKILHFFLFFIFPISLQSQTTFQKTYGTTPNTAEFGYVVMATEDGGALLLNLVSNTNSGSYDIQLMKIDENGEILSQRTYETPDQEEELQMLRLPSGDYIIGASVNLRTGGNLVRLMRIDGDSHETVWIENYNYENGTIFRSVVYGQYGNITLLTSIGRSYFLNVYSESGEQVWTTLILQPSNYPIYYFRDLAATSDGGYILSGGKRNEEGVLLYKTDAFGSKEWESFTDIGLTDTESGYVISQTSDGAYLTIGVNLDYEPTFTLVKNGEDGENNWKHILGNTEFSVIHHLDIIETTDGSYFSLFNSFKNGGVRMMSNRGELLWNALLDYGGGETFYSTTQLSNGNLLLLGSSNSFNGTGEDVLLVAFSLEGEELWHKTYGQAGDKDVSYAYSLSPTSSGDYLLFSNTVGIEDDAEASTWNLLNVDGDNGDLNWSKGYDFDIGQHRALSIKPIETGGYALFGTYNPNSAEELSITRLSKIDELGEEVWTHTYDSLIGSFSFAMQPTSDQGFIMGGGDLWITDVRCIKTDENGLIQWQQTYDGHNITGIQELSDGSFLLLSTFHGYSGVMTRLIKTDENGNLIWSKNIADETVYLFYCFNAVETQDGSYVVVGYKYDFTNDLSRMYFAKISQEGDLLWEKEIRDDKDYFRGFDVEETQEGDLVFVGTSRFDNNPILGQGFLLKTDTNGNEIWRKYYGAEIGMNAALLDMYQNEDGSFALTGFINYQNSIDVYFLTTDSEGNTMTVNIFNPSLQYNFHIAPNPNNGQFQLSLDGNIGVENLQLSILDLAGRQLEERTIPPISQQVDLSHLPSGTYFIKLGNGQQFSTKRVVIE